MSKYFFSPLNQQTDLNNWNTYSGHGIGNLDYPQPFDTPVYAICDGVVTYVLNPSERFQDAQGNTYCCIQSSEASSGLGIPFKIRYLHGEYSVSVGDVVKKGQQIGTIQSYGNSTGPHLHIDFSANLSGAARDPAVYGSLDKASRIWTGISPSTIQNRRFKISENVDLNTITRLQNASGLSDNEIGYCWLVMAQTPEKRVPSDDGTGYNSVMDMSYKLTSDSDWDALYGMVAYEESVLFSEFDTNEEAKAILEWVVRVFRNRLFSGQSVDSICRWNSGLPGRTDAESRANQVPSNIKEFAKNIISGQDYFYVEKYAQRYKYGSWPDTTHWFNRLYSADTFYGGSSARWPNSTLAAIPFSYGPYFFFEGEFTIEVLNKFWPNGLSGESAYPNPYLS